MRFFKQLLNFYINSSIHVGLSAFSLSWVTLIEFDISFDNSVLFFIFFATITGYNFVKYFGLAKFHHRSLANWLKLIQLFSLICFVLLCFFAAKLQVNSLVCIAVFGVVTFLYAIPFLPKKIFLDSQQNLRSISGLKIYVIGIVWAGVTVFLPLINNDVEMNGDVMLTAMQRFVFIIVLMLPFEIRDLQYDSIKLATIPQKIGEKRTKMMGVFLLLLFLILEYLKNQSDITQTIIVLIVAVITLLFLVFSKIDQGKYYSGFWVEMTPVVWLLLLVII